MSSPTNKPGVNAAILRKRFVLGELHIELLGFVHRQKLADPLGIWFFVASLTDPRTEEELERKVCSLMNKLIELKFVHAIKPAGEFMYITRHVNEFPAGICRHCGCTDNFGCEEGCWWISEARFCCSSCQGKIENG